MNSSRAWFIGLVLASFAGFIALAQTPAAKSAASSKGISVLHPTAGNKVSGTVTFTPVTDGVQVHAEIAGLTPGKHGFHVHEFGDCSAADASSAGAHFNPTNQPHAGPDAAARHEGDMGNVEADASGNAKLDYVDHQISLANDAKSAIGRSVVVHAMAGWVGLMAVLLLVELAETGRELAYGTRTPASTPKSIMVVGGVHALIGAPAQVIRARNIQLP